MPGETYLTQFICICEHCDQETMAVEVDGYVTAECGKCGNKRVFARPDGRLNASIVAARLKGHFMVSDRYTRRTGILYPETAGGHNLRFHVETSTVPADG